MATKRFEMMLKRKALPLARARTGFAVREGSTISRNAIMTIKFLTLYARDIQNTAKVYKCLGMSFSEEQHGVGPVHLSCEIDGLVIEIYPGLEMSSRSALLGFEVKDLEDTKRNLQNAGAVIVKDIAVVADARRLIAGDPDGRELFVQEVRQVKSNCWETAAMSRTAAVSIPFEQVVVWGNSYANKIKEL